MPITLSPLTPGFAAEVGDVDLWAPLSDDDLQAVRRAFAEHPLRYSRRRLRFTGLHRRRVGDLPMRDDRCAMRPGTPFEDTRWPRDMQRATVTDRPDAFGALSIPAAAGTPA
jgi:hypothetical protein